MRLRFALIAVLVATFLVAAARRRAVAPGTLQLDTRRSFAVTDQAILDGFSFERVMKALVERSGARNVTATSLYRQWLDTQNPKPGLAAESGPHCNDFVNGDGRPSFNGFARRCPTPEGALATSNPFVPPQYIPLALINRFDLTPVDGSNCGQYRMIFARKAGATPFDRFHVIFEGVLPNPEPARGLGGCRPVAQFWAGLSSIGSVAERRARLEEFFFTGIPGFEPVIHPDHYNQASTGGIRTFQWSQPVAPRFYQFRLERSCTGYECSLSMQPDVLENMPHGRLFDSRNNSPQAQRFRDEFVRNVEPLAILDVNRFFMNIPREYLMAESDPGDGEPAFSYVLPFATGFVSGEGRAFNERIQTELDRVGSRLKPLEIINRAEAQTCHWCHLATPSFGYTSRPFEHVSESIVEPGEAGTRYAISPAMRNVFIPHRMEVLRNFLSTNTLPQTHSGVTIGGGRVVQ